MREIEIIGKIVEITKVHRFKRSFYKLKLQIELNNGRHMSTLVYASKYVTVREFTERLSKESADELPLGNVDMLKEGDIVYLTCHLEHLQHRFSYASTKELNVTIADEAKLMTKNRGLNKISVQGLLVDTPVVQTVDGVVYAHFALNVLVPGSKKPQTFNATARNLCASFLASLKAGDKVELNGYFKSQIHTITPKGKPFDFNTLNLSARNIIKK